jgi:hypothetical protein
MNTHTHNGLYEKERFWLFFALTVLFVVSAAYVYFLCASITHVVIRKEVDQEITELGSSVSALEAKYIEMQHGVSVELATRAGYHVTRDKIFIDRTGDTLSLAGE